MRIRGVNKLVRSYILVLVILCKIDVSDVIARLHYVSLVDGIRVF